MDSQVPSVKSPELSIAERAVWRAGMQHLKRRDPVLGKVVSRVGPVEFELDGRGYEALVESIMYQQLAGSAARAILDRFKGLYGGQIPRPQDYLATKDQVLRSAGLSRQKIAYIRDVCERMVKGQLDFKGMARLSDDGVVQELDAVKGVGRWTAEMFLIFVLGRRDVLPVDDLGVQKAVKKLYRLRKLPDRKKFEKLAVNWHPYCSIATLYLWRSTDKMPLKD
jgi:DNA-3-methyladenine glycosylase II